MSASIHQSDDGSTGLGYWRKPPDKRLTRAYWFDPWPEFEGMLTAEHIVRYHEAIGGTEPDAEDGQSRGMIRPLQASLLKPAGYELTLGPTCLLQGEPKVLCEREPHLVIPKNAVAFVSMQQVLCLPHYIVARFNLTIDLIYRGLLLGTGPQVDPGYQGGLSCPLHNISSEEITIRLGEPFAKMDFVKTMPREQPVREHMGEINSEQELARWLRSGQAPRDVRLFKEGDPPWKEPIFGYLHGRKPRSSVQQISEEVQESRRTVEKLRAVNFAGILAVAAGVAALIFAALQLSDGMSTTKAELQDVRTCVQSLTFQDKPQKGARQRAPITPLALATCLER